MLSKSLSTSAKVARLYAVCPKLADWCRVLFPLLLAHADDHGRLQGDEQTVKLQVDPISPRKLPDFVAALHLMHEVGLITWYQVGDRKVVEIVDFHKHQDLKGHDQRPWKLPPCPGPESLIGRNRRDDETRLKPDVGESSPKSPQISLKEEKGREENLTEEKGREGSSTTSVEPVVTLLEFPTVGAEKTWRLTETQCTEWQSLYSNLDILAEAYKALAWLQVNANRQKTAGGMARFLVNWFNRSVDRGRSGPAATTAGRTDMLAAATKGFLDS